MDNLQMNVVCAICLEVWDQPKTLPCGHIFCEGCVQLLVKEEPDFLVETITCPECREMHIVPGNGLAQSWPTSRRLQNMADEMRDISKLRQTPRGSSRTSTSKFTEADPQTSYLTLKHHDVGGPKKKNRRVFDVISMTIQLCNKDGQIIAGIAKQHNIKVFVGLKPQHPGGSSDDSKDMQIPCTLTAEGKFFMDFKATVCGLHQVRAYLSDSQIKQSPFDIPVMPRDMLGCEIKGPLKGPRDVIAFGKDHFLVADGIAKAVHLIDHCGREVKTLKMKSNLAEKFSPMAIAMYGRKIFVTDMANRCIHVYDNVEAVPVQFGQKNLSRPTGITVGHTGEVYVADSKCIAMFDRDYKFVKSIHFNGRGSHDQINNPQKMIMNKAGDKLLLADQGDEKHNCIRILNISKNERPDTNIAIRVGSNSAKPCGIAVDRGDNIYVSVKITPQSGGDQLGKRKAIAKGLLIAYTSSGYFLGYFGNELENPDGLDVIDSEDLSKSPMIYVADSPGHGRNGSLKGFII